MLFSQSLHSLFQAIKTVALLSRTPTPTQQASVFLHDSICFFFCCWFASHSKRLCSEVWRTATFPTSDSPIPREQGSKGGGVTNHPTPYTASHLWGVFNLFDWIEMTYKKYLQNSTSQSADKTSLAEATAHKIWNVWKLSQSEATLCKKRKELSIGVFFWMDILRIST